MKESTSPTIDKYFKVHPSSTREEDTLSKEVGDRSTIVGEEKEEPLPSCTKTETDKVDEVDSVELKPKPKQIKNDGTKTQGVPESPQILAKVSAQSKTLQMETKATGRTSNKRKGEGRRKKTVVTTRESDGDFIPPSG